MPNTASTTSAAPDSERLGLRIAALRQRSGFTLDHLSERSGVSKGHLSRIERGQKSPSISLLMRLAAIFDMPVSELMGEQAGSSDIAVTRAMDRPSLGKGLEVLHSASEDARYSAFFYTPPGSFTDQDLTPHAGHETIYVLSGSVEVQIADQPQRLEQGDSVSFSAGLPHNMRSIGENQAQVLIIVG